MWKLKDLFKPNMDKIVAEKNVNSLIKLLSRGRDRIIRARAAEALGKIGDARAVESLIQVLENKMEEYFVRCHAAIALTKIGDTRAVEALGRALKHESREIRHDAARALGRIGGPSVIIPLMRNLVESPDDYQRALSDIAFKKNLNESAVEPLFRALKDENRDVRFKAIESLGKIGNVRAIEYLKQALDYEDKNIRVSAAIALGKRGDASGIEYLVQACDVSAKFGQMSAFLKLQIICDNLKRGEMHDDREKVQEFA